MDGLGENDNYRQYRTATSRQSKDGKRGAPIGITIKGVDKSVGEHLDTEDGTLVSDRHLKLKRWTRKP